VPLTPYHGTPQEIAQQLEADSEAHGWIEDDVPKDAEYPLSSQQITELADLRTELNPGDFNLPKSAIPSPKDLPSADRFRSKAAPFLRAREAASQLGGRVTAPRVLSLSRMDDETLCHVEKLARECCEIQRELEGRAELWVRRAAKDIMQGNHHSWLSLYRYTAETLERLYSAPLDASPTVQTPPEVDETQLLGDAKDLLQHLTSGGGFGVWLFRAPVVKRCRYLWRSYRFNGRLCDSASSLQALIDHVERLAALRGVWSEWSAYCSPPSGAFRQQLESLKACQRLLGRALALQKLADATGKAMFGADCQTPPLVGTTWASELLEDVDAARVVQELVAAESSVNEMAAPVLALGEHATAHEVVGRLVEAARTLSADDYASGLATLSEIWEVRNHASRCLELDARLRAVAPRLAEALEDESQREALVPRLETFEDAWAWKRAQAWLNRFVSESAGDLEGRIAVADSRLSQLTEELVVLRAWQSCNDHLSQDYEKQGALQAWQQIMRRIGRGTGKHVETHRRDARKYMDRCRDAIPAWIMPLHRVAETVEMKPGAFDIVIVDEASQTGPEGLILQYIGKQCIIVGDDKQISPEAVGVNQNAVRALMEHYLSDFPFAETLAPTSSLFDQATIRYGGNRVTLREHFRCMPEIIRFSNDLCYSDTPLVPLRQYPPKRLEPIVVRRVVDGYREGQRDRVINRPEAAAVATTVIECLNDPRYEGKTMGVICLQGHAQAQLIEQMLLDAVGPEPFEKRQLICGDAYSFQGDERDIVFMSMVAATEGDGRFAALTAERFRQRFNVACSRARDQVWLFHSVRREDLNPECMRRRLLEYYYNPGTEVLERDLSVCESQFERDVATELISRAYRIVPQYPSAGKRIDLVVEGTTSRLAIECDGDKWHGADRYEADMARQRMLERCGWKFIRIRGSVFYSNRPKAVRNLIDAIGTEGIVPYAGTDDATVPPAWVEEVLGNQCKEALEAHTVDRAEENVAQQHGLFRKEPQETAADRPTATTPGSTGAETKTRRSPQAGTRLDPVGVQRLLAAIAPEAPKATTPADPACHAPRPRSLTPKR